ncbi:MAG TPA: hypothetical protein PLH72_05255 [Vicinamibacterales bacterium]|nr:hypothetical protein [Vicinamibacterales bacterium]
MTATNPRTTFEPRARRLTRTGFPARVVGTGAVLLPELLRRVEAEYREMPGINLTAAQAERLFGLDDRTCAVVLATLLDRRILRRTAGGTYRRGAQLEDTTTRTRAWKEW